MEKSRKIFEVGGKESCYFWQSTDSEAEAAREDWTVESKIRIDDDLKVTSVKSC